MRTALLAFGLGLGVTACGGGKPSHDECVKTVAQEMFFEDLGILDQDFGDPKSAKLVGDIGKAVGPTKLSAREAAEVIRSHEAGTGKPPQGPKRIAACEATASRAHVDCVADATSLAEGRACPP